MTRAGRVGATLAMAAATAATLAIQPTAAEAHGRGGGHGGGHAVVIGGGFYSPWLGYGFAPYWGWGWGAYPPAYYGPAGGVDMNYAMMAGFGATELNVKPNRADVWVDGKYVGEARDLDGYPSYLWLPDGGHKIAVYKGGFKTFEDEIAVHRGMKSTIKVRLEPGESEPPGTKPADRSDDKKHDDKKDETHER